MPGVSRLILVASKEFPRYSEGDIIELTDGRLLLAIARKIGNSDMSPGTLIGMFSRDRGLTWDDEPHVIKSAWDDVTDLMSVSFVRSPRGIHMIFLGRGQDKKSDTRIYHMISTDEGKTWGDPQKISESGYHIVNNARVIRAKSGRIIVPCAHTNGDINREFDSQHIFCKYSDDNGETWKQSNTLAMENQPLMEPSVAQCADGSLYMTIRTKLLKTYEARSRDDGSTWIELRESPLPAPAAPATVVRAPDSDELWMLWCNNAKGDWKGRSPQVFAASRDHGKTWSEPKVFEHDPKGSFGYISFDVVKDHALLTYYDWRDRGQKGFQDTSLRERIIPLGWFRGEVVPPVFQTSRQPVLREDKKIVSMNAGILRDDGRWRLWYTSGTHGPKTSSFQIAYAESKDAGKSWEKSGEVASLAEANVDIYHPCVHREGDAILIYAWRQSKSVNGLYRYVSTDDGKTFALDPQEPLIVSPFASREAVDNAKGRVSNDAFHVVKNDNGTYDYFGACIEKATDPRTIIKHDNAAGYLRFIGRATSTDGVNFTPTRVILRPDYDTGDAFDTQFYGMQVFRYRNFHLGLLQTYHVDSQIIQPEWAWSHDGESWARTRTPCISLGDEGSFDSRMILFGQPIFTDNELIWLYSGYDWRHNEADKREVTSAIGRATMRRKDLDDWLDTLPKP